MQDRYQTVLLFGPWEGKGNTGKILWCPDSFTWHVVTCFVHSM